MVAATRPDRIHKWSDLSVHRLEPPAGTASTGYPYGFKVPRVHWNWVHWASGAWAFHLDASTLRGADNLDSTQLLRLTDSQLGFLIGSGGLAQRPVTGGVYILEGERADMTPVGTAAPVFTFAPTDNNRVWARVRRDGGRSAYPEVTVTQSDVSPGAGYVKLGNAVTNATQITSYFPATQFRGLAFAAYNDFQIRASLEVVPELDHDATAFSVGGVSASAPVCYIYHADPAAFNACIQVGPNPQADGIVTFSDGDQSAALRAFTSNGSRGVSVEASDTGAALVYLNQGVQNYGIALVPSAFDAPHDAGSPYAACTRVSATTSGAGLLWLDPTGVFRYPWASAQTPGRFDSGALADSGNINQGVANTTIATTSTFTLTQNTTHLIHVEIGASTISTPNFGVSVTIFINGVADTYWNSRTWTPVGLTANTSPWLSTRIIYRHSTATTAAATVSVRVTHGAGVGSINYRAPHISVVLGLP